MVHNLSNQNSLVSQWMHELRSIHIQEDRLRFRKNLGRLGEIIAYEISKLLKYDTITTETALGESDTRVLQDIPILASILRAGIPLQQGILNYFDQADCAFIGAYRKHHRDGSFEIAQEYITCPNIQDRVLILADPMIATGSSAILALEALLENGKPSQVHIATVIACNIGLEKIKRKFPQVHIWAGDIDDELTAKGYIVPGLGDAGDLAYGNKQQA